MKLKKKLLGRQSGNICNCLGEGEKRKGESHASRVKLACSAMEVEHMVDKYLQA